MNHLIAGFLNVKNFRRKQTSQLLFLYLFAIVLLLFKGDIYPFRKLVDINIGWLRHYSRPRATGPFMLSKQERQ